MKIASKETRSIVVQACLARTASRKQLSKIFGYTTASIGKWVHAYQQDRQLSSLPRDHTRPAFDEQELKELKTLLEKEVDLTLSEIKEHFGETCSLVTVCFKRPALL